MRRLLLLWCAAPVLLVGCTSGIPYRAGEYVTDASCKTFYDDYDATLLQDQEPTKIDRDNQCWKRSREKHTDYDLFFVEFDDQGWVQGSGEQSNPVENDHLSKLYNAIEDIHRESAANNERLTLVLFVHGWQHSADAMDLYAHSFRGLLRAITLFENSGEKGRPKNRTVGIYVGWRGQSFNFPLIEELTFWERKNVAERVSQGEVQELMRWLDVLRDTSRDKKGNRDVNMFTIGHSFGGLIVFEALGSELLRNAVRFKANAAEPDNPSVSRVGDLVLIVNPAFEGARYEPLRAAANRMRNIPRNQLPIMIVATSKWDLATGWAFPIARAFSTAFESMSGWWGPQWHAAVETVGHNSRYITHRLSKCKDTNEECQSACGKSVRVVGANVEDEIATEIRREFAYMGGLAKSGFDAGRPKPSRQYLCNGLELQWVPGVQPDNNPFWVVQTTGDIMNGHNDIFNPAMMHFVRQMYMAFLAAQRNAPQ
jgi:pimeloyl-ACP methyl ester carboxylesterase